MIGESLHVPTVPELIAQVHVLDAQIQQTDREIAARPQPVHPRGPKESAEWAELQTWWVTNHWRPFVAQWDRGMRDVRDYELGIQRPGMPPLVNPRQSAKFFVWVEHMRERYNFLRSSAAASFYIDVAMPRAGGFFEDVPSNQGPDAFRAAVAETNVKGERDMTAYAGADGQSYPEVAARAVQSIHAQHRSPFYGYVRSGINQKIYLFGALDDARTWFSQHVQSQPDHDYAAVFAATDLRAPIAGMQHFNRAHVSGDYVGNWLPFFLGLPLGGLAGYFLRRWQEQNPGQALPFVPPGKIAAPQIPPPAAAPSAPSASGDPYVGGPWLDIDVGQDYYDDDDGDDDDDDDGYGGHAIGGPWVDLVGQDYGYAIGCPPIGQDYGYAIGCPPIGGPWVDLVGAQADDAARRRAWPQTRALIQSAISEVSNYATTYPAEAYVWSLDAPSRAPYAGRARGSVVMLEGTTNIVPFSSQGEALDYLREVAQTRPVALAMFERSSPHWPNPTAWRKSDDPAHEQLIAQHVASHASTRSSGTYAGGDTMIGAAIDDVRRRAQTLADKRAGNVIGVIHTAKDGLWHTLAFRTSDDADDWLGTATHDPAAFTYAAYYDKDDFSWPHAVNEKIGGARTSAVPSTPVRRAPATTSGQWWS